MEALAELVKQQVAAQATLVAELRELKKKFQQKSAGPSTPEIIAVARATKKGDKINLCSASGSDSDTPVVPRRSPRRRSPRLKNKVRQDVRRVKREKKEGQPLKRTISFEDAVRKSRGKRKAKSGTEKRLRKSLGVRLTALDGDLHAGKFHDIKGKFDNDAFFIKVAPLIKEEIGSDFSDDELPNRYLLHAQKHMHNHAQTHIHNHAQKDFTFCTHKKTDAWHSAKTSRARKYVTEKVSGTASPLRPKENPKGSASGAGKLLQPSKLTTK